MICALLPKVTAIATQKNNSKGDTPTQNTALLLYIITKHGALY